MQYWSLLAQSSPPGSGPEPSALHWVATVPSHVAEPAVHWVFVQTGVPSRTWHSALRQDCAMSSRSPCSSQRSAPGTQKVGPASPFGFVVVLAEPPQAVQIKPNPRKPPTSRPIVPALIVHSPALRARAYWQRTQMPRQFAEN